MHKWGDIVLVVVAFGFVKSLGHVADKVLESLVLLGADLLDDVGEHILELLGLARAGHNEKVLADGVLNYNFKG